jgi:ABC-type transport system substrate-binding protein
LPSVDVRFFDTVTASYQAFVAGQLDWTRVPLEEVESAGRTYGRSLFVPYPAELFYAFNLKSPTFADARFRSAIARSIDRDAIVGGVYQGTVRSLTGVTAEGADLCGSPCSHDLTSARALVASVFPTGGPPVPTVRIDFDQDPTQQKVAEAVRAGLADAGIPAELRPHSADSYADFIAGDDKEFFRLGWVAPFVSPDAFLGPLFASGSPFNLTRFSSPAVDAALAAARSSADTAAQLTSYQAAEREVLSSVAVVPIAQFLTYSVASPSVRGMVLTAAGTFDAATVSLAARAG